LTTNIFVNTIYNLNENIIDEISSNEIRISNFKFTKDNSKLYYKEGRILDYIDPNNQKYTYNLKDKIMETQGNANQWYVFMGSEKRFTLLKNSITDVSQESEIPYLIINYTQDGILNLRCSYDVEPPLELIISDLIGNRIYQSQLNELVSTKELSVKLNLSNGIYLVKAKTENRIYTQKFQVLR
jgi:hypothetical protein